MTRPYSPYSPARTELLGEREDRGGYDGYEDHDEYDGYEDHEDYADYEDYADFGFDDGPVDRRWMWVAGVAGVILMVAVICTVVILGGGDSGSVSATVSPAPPQTSQPAPATTPAPPVATSTPAPPPAAPLSPETVTTVTPSPTAGAEPSPALTEATPAPRPNTITYRVTGNRQLIDLVTVIYTDQRGALQTDVNVALPWAKTVALDPGVTLSSVTATSVVGQLNCSITDGAGNMIAEQNNNMMIATCIK